MVGIIPIWQTVFRGQEPEPQIITSGLIGTIYLWHKDLCSADGGFTASCIVTVVIDTVTIKKDGAFNKVVFNKSGKVWRCINHDMIFDEDNMNNTFLIQRSNHNFFTYYNENDPLLSNTTPK